MVTGLDLIGHNRPLQRHWLKRTAAFMVDAVLVLFPLWIVLELLQVQAIQVYGFASGMFFFLYSAISEGLWQRTPGKELLGLKVYSLVGNMDLHKGMVRSVAKFFWYILPPLDTLIGLATGGDPRQRLSDRISGTTVVGATVPTSVQMVVDKNLVKAVRRE